jgi:predicted transcriptional regulator
METETNKGIERVRDLADSLSVIGNQTRFSIVSYCIKPQRFTDIIQTLKLNPASFKFHLGVLTEHELLCRVERGVYQTTELGNLLVQLVDVASKIKDDN